MEAEEEELAEELVEEELVEEELFLFNDEERKESNASIIQGDDGRNLFIRFNLSREVALDHEPDTKHSMAQYPIGQGTSADDRMPCD